MIRLFVIVILGFTVIEARQKPKIQIFEIHDTDTGLKLRKINPKSVNVDAMKTDLKDLLQPKSSQVDVLTKQLIDKLKDVRGEDIYMVSENPNLFVMGKDFKPQQKMTKKENRNRIRPGTLEYNQDLLLKLLAPKNNKKQDRGSMLRNGIDGINDRTSAPRQKRVYASDDTEDYDEK